jgi:hypothetical protein
MDYEFWPALLAGMIGGAVMAMVVMVAKRGGLTEMDIAVIEGAMFTGDKKAAKAVGMFMHLVVMSGLIIGSVYAALFAWLELAPENAWWVGALLGIGHAFVGGAMVAMMPAMHPRVGTAGPTPAAATGPDLHMGPPGFFARNYGSAAIPVWFTGHVVYGLVVGLVYAWLAA